MASDTKKKGNTTKDKDIIKKRTTAAKAKSSTKKSDSAKKDKVASSVKKTNKTATSKSLTKSPVKIKAETKSTTKASVKKTSAANKETKVTTKKTLSKDVSTKSNEKKPIVRPTTKKAGSKKSTKKVVENEKVVVPIKIEETNELQQLNTNKVDNNDKVQTKKEYDDEKFANTILGLELPVGDSQDRKTRLLNYARDALIFAVVIPILDLFAMLFIDSYKAYPITNNVPINYCLTLLIDFVMIFILTYIIDYIHGENSVRRMKK